MSSITDEVGAHEFQRLRRRISAVEKQVVQNTNPHELSGRTASQALMHQGILTMGFDGSLHSESVGSSSSAVLLQDHEQVIAQMPREFAVALSLKELDNRLCFSRVLETLRP